MLILPQFLPYVVGLLLFIFEIPLLLLLLLSPLYYQVIDSDEGSDDKAVTAMGILNTIETILTVMEDQKEIMSSLEAIVLTVVGAILQNNVMEFYEEVMSIIYSLTCTSVSTHMWQVSFIRMFSP